MPVMILQTWQFIVLALAGWLNQQPQDIVAYHGERNHQGLGNQLIQPGESVGKAEGEIRCSERLGGLLRYYYRAA